MTRGASQDFRGEAAGATQTCRRLPWTPVSTGRSKWKFGCEQNQELRIFLRLITTEAKVLLNYRLFSNYGCQQGPISAGFSGREQTYSILTACSVLRLSDIMLKRKPGCSYYYRVLQLERFNPCQFILHTSSLLE